jgi:hypothetical protein
MRRRGREKVARRHGYKARERQRKSLYSRVLAREAVLRKRVLRGALKIGDDGPSTLYQKLERPINHRSVAKKNKIANMAIVEEVAWTPIEYVVNTIKVRREVVLTTMRKMRMHLAVVFEKDARSS